MIRAAGKREFVKLGILKPLAFRQVPSPGFFVAAQKVKDRRLLEAAFRLTAMLGILENDCTAPLEIGGDATIHGMEGRHSDARTPDRNAVCNQPVA
ncbi:UNVERIFIED_ORG: hypothetical protein GGD47_000866 [Rhizobium etli]